MWKTSGWEEVDVQKHANQREADTGIVDRCSTVKEFIGRPGACRPWVGGQASGDAHTPPSFHVEVPEGVAFAVQACHPPTKSEHGTTGSRKKETVVSE